MNETDDFPIHLNISFDLLKFCIVIASSEAKFESTPTRNNNKTIIK